MNRKNQWTMATSVFALAGWAAFAAAEVQYPEGTQDFEAMSVGASVESLFDWVVVNNSAPPSQFQILAANDVLGDVQVHNTSTRWLRVDDQDGTDVQNRFYSPPVTSPSDQDYAWTFFVNLEAMPPGGAGTKPKIVVQHLAPGFANVWGIEFAATGASLIVTGPGGPAASTPLYPISGSTGVGEWVRIRLAVDFSTNRVSAQANNAVPVSLPINPAPALDKKVFRFCYRGEGPGNVNRMLIDDVTVQVGASLPTPTVSEWGLVVMALLLITGGKVFFHRRMAAS
jgi:hypothetical protein